MLELVEERPRRGCTERVLAARADAFVVDPGVLGAGADRRAGPLRRRAPDRRGVGRRPRRRADAGAPQAEGTRLLTFTIEAEVRFARPPTSSASPSGSPTLVAEAAAAHGTRDGRPYRLVLGGHPHPSTEVPDA